MKEIRLSMRIFKFLRKQSMGYNDLINLVSEYPKMSLVASGVVLYAGYRICKLFNSHPPKSNLSGYPNRNKNSPRLGTGGAGMPAIPGVNDDYFIQVAKEIKNGEH